MRILGITGGIATGKSTVTAMLAEEGAPTLSADAIARELLHPGTPETRAALAAFPACADAQQPETIDRRALGHLIFANSEARVSLEALLHPPIIARLRAAAQAWRGQPGGCAALEIPLLFEAGLETTVDQIVVVSCAPRAQVARLRSRLGVDTAEAQRQIAAQWPLEDKIARAHTVITTDGTLVETQSQVKQLWEETCG